MFKQRRICLVGATGAIGTEMLEQAVSREDIRIVAVARHEVPLPPGARMEVFLADTPGWDDAIAASGAKVLVCALGTTWAKSDKDEAAFRAVDYDLVLQCGKAAKAAGIDHMILVSSVGASIASSQFYLRVKGEIEDALAKLHFRRLDIVRPGLLLSKRENDRRLGERLGILATPLTNLFLHGGARRFRSISTATVVRAIFALAKEKPGGRFIHEYDAMHYAIRRSGG